LIENIKNVVYLVTYGHLFQQPPQSMVTPQHFLSVLASGYIFYI